MGETEQQKKEREHQKDLQRLKEFRPMDASDMNFDLLAERTRYLKENPKGVSEMCKSMEDMRNQTDLAARKQVALNFLKLEKLSYEEIAKCSELPIEEVMILAGQIGA